MLYFPPVRWGKFRILIDDLFYSFKIGHCRTGQPLVCLKRERIELAARLRRFIRIDTTIGCVRLHLCGAQRSIQHKKPLYSNTLTLKRDVPPFISFFHSIFAAKNHITSYHIILQLVEGTYNDKVCLKRLRGAFEEIIEVFGILILTRAAFWLSSCPGVRV